MPQPNNPLVIVFKLLVSDPSLRARFLQDPAAVFYDLGLGCPADFVGPRGKFCPAMPDLPEGDAAFDIRHQYWRHWLAGAPPMLEDFLATLDRDRLFPHRSSFSSQQEWDHFIASIKVMIGDELSGFVDLSSEEMPGHP